MLKEIIEKGYYSFEQRFDDWQEAIRASYRPLLEAGVVEISMCRQLLTV